ncbi:hypothetical protein BC834DRAFT_629331 [Gloeopeniophorella convolvens]|nr:hypothetical protein BC834DRAFT_629331 [Gloeopeniophorella convolvens]
MYLTDQTCAVLVFSRVLASKRLHEVASLPDAQEGIGMPICRSTHRDMVRCSCYVLPMSPFGIMGLAPKHAHPDPRIASPSEIQSGPCALSPRRPSANPGEQLAIYCDAPKRPRALSAAFFSLCPGSRPTETAACPAIHVPHAQSPHRCATADADCTAAVRRPASERTSFLMDLQSFKSMLLTPLPVWPTWL